MQLDQVTRDCQSQSEPSVALSRLALGLPKPLEDKGQEIGRDAGAGITDQNRQRARIDITGDADDTVLRRELDRIRHDVAEHLMKALVIALGARRALRHPSQQRDPFRLGGGNHARDDRIDEPWDEQRPALDIEFARSDPRDVQDVRDELGLQVRIAGDHVNRVADAPGRQHRVLLQ